MSKARAPGWAPAERHRRPPRTGPAPQRAACPGSDDTHARFVSKKTETNQPTNPPRHKTDQPRTNQPNPPPHGSQHPARRSPQGPGPAAAPGSCGTSCPSAAGGEGLSHAGLRLVHGFSLGGGASTAFHRRPPSSAASSPRGEPSSGRRGSSGSRGRLTAGPPLPLSAPQPRRSAGAADTCAADMPVPPAARGRQPGRPRGSQGGGGRLLPSPPPRPAGAPGDPLSAPRAGPQRRSLPPSPQPLIQRALPAAQPLPQAAAREENEPRGATRRLRRAGRTEALPAPLRLARPGAALPACRGVRGWRPP